MSNIIDFPNSARREWRQIENDLRDSYKNFPLGPAAVEECLPDIRAHWDEIFVSFNIQPSYQVPPSSSQEQRAAIQAAMEAGVNFMIERLQKERARHFALLVGCEFKAAYYKLNM